jgi:xanthine dehydrogenase molybdopterin-binding subunit B
MPDAPFRHIGKRRRAVEHRRFVTGKGRYAADIQLPGLLHVAVVASPHASARIASIDASAALAIPGVHGALTGDQMQSEIDPILPGVDAPDARRFPLARGVVRYAGEWVVAVVAECWRASTPARHAKRQSRSMPSGVPLAWARRSIKILRQGHAPGHGLRPAAAADAPEATQDRRSSTP